MIRKTYTFFASLNVSLWLTFGVMLFLAIGSFVSGGEGGSINDMPLFLWLRETPIGATWWLWGALVIVALLVVNTIVCSIESLRSKAGRSRFLVMIAPQVMHLGFLFIVLAHLLSAYGGFKQPVDATEGYTITFPDGKGLNVERIDATMSPMGMPTDYSARVRFVGTGGAPTTIRPNHPLFYKGFGIYLKHAEPYPQRTAYLEVHREPGAPAALVGAIFFTVGNVVLLAVRRGRRVGEAEQALNGD